MTVRVTPRNGKRGFMRRLNVVLLLLFFGVASTTPSEGQQNSLCYGAWSNVKEGQEDIVGIEIIVLNDEMVLFFGSEGHLAMYPTRNVQVGARRISFDVEVFGRINGYCEKNKMIVERSGQMDVDVLKKGSRVIKNYLPIGVVRGQ